MTKKNVLVIGGGAAGHQIAYQLRDTANVTLVDPKTYWEVPMALPRLLVEPDGLPARMRYDSFLGAATHVQGKVVSLKDGAARVALGTGEQQTLAYDYAVIASGSAYIDPLIKAQAKTEENRSAEIAAMNALLRTARSVVVAGGGPVGIETAAELAETFPNLRVTIVHGGNKLLELAPSKFAGWAERTLGPKGVNFVLNDFVSEPGQLPEDGQVRTSGGRTIEADVVIWAAGTKPSTEYVLASWPASVQADGSLKVDAYLRLEGHPNVFVAGDVTNLPEGRLAIIGGLHAKSVVANLKKLLVSPSPETVKLKPYKPSVPGDGHGQADDPVAGPRRWIVLVAFRAVPRVMARKIKSRDMLVGMSRKSLGLAF